MQLGLISDAFISHSISNIVAAFLVFRVNGDTVQKQSKKAIIPTANQQMIRNQTKQAAHYTHLKDK